MARRVGAGAAALLVLLLLSAGTAGAHANVTGAEPSDGTILTNVPERIELRIGGKKATAEGDPVEVFDPAGRRIDTGDALVPESGDVIDAYIAGSGFPDGVYQVLYEIVSADTHVISGRLSFTVARPLGATPDPAARRTLTASVGPTSTSADTGATSGPAATGSSGDTTSGEGQAGAAVIVPPGPSRVAGSGSTSDPSLEPSGGVGLATASAGRAGRAEPIAVTARPAAGAMARGGPIALPVLMGCALLVLYPLGSRRRQRRRSLTGDTP